MTAPVQHPMYIDGQFEAGRGDAWIEVINPATEALISRIPDGSAEDAQRAILAAERAQPGWEALPAIERAGWLRKIAAGIRERADEIAALIVAEGGKIQQLAAVEVSFTAEYLDYMAEWARRYEGEIVQSDRPGENILVFKRALGVTTGILPWNFPFFLIARKLATNYRILCASPEFVAQHGTPKQLNDLSTFPCLVIKERDHPFGIWQMRNKEGAHSIKVTGPLSSNHGEVVHQWCLDGQGIALRSWWDVCDNIAGGHLVHVLPEYYQPANIWAVYVSRLATSAKIRITVEYLRRYFAENYPKFTLE